LQVPVHREFVWDRWSRSLHDQHPFLQTQPQELPALCRQFYSTEGTPEPLLYARFSTPLDHGAVRLAVLQPPAAIRATAHEAADAVSRALPEGTVSCPCTVTCWCVHVKSEYHQPH